MEAQSLIKTQGVSKKFTRDIRANMYYGLLGMLGVEKLIPGQRPTLRDQEFWAIDEVDFELRAGEILAVVGLNGSGKTTLMRLISGIYPADHGQILLRKNLRVTAIFALNSGMQPLFTGRENIYIKGAMFGMTKAEIEAKIDFIEAFSGLGSKLDSPFGNYSSGMKARLSYTVAMATEPDVFIIDEALAVGDSAFKAKCFDNLKEFVKEPGKAVIFVSNHIHKVMKIASRVLVMDEGKIVHGSTDVKAGLAFYIENSYKNLEPDVRQRKISRIQEYED